MNSSKRHSVTENEAATFNESHNLESESLPGCLCLPPAAESRFDCCPRPRQPYLLVSLAVLELCSEKHLANRVGAAEANVS